jgi:hypothetical protein
MTDVVDRMVACTTAADLQAADLPGTPYLRYAASELLDAFRWLKRYADDLTVGPNRFVEQLLYINQWVLGGNIHGLYPTILTLEKQDSSIDKCVALDMRILTSETHLFNTDNVHTTGCAYSYAVLYDRRRLPGFTSSSSSCYPLSIITGFHIFCHTTVSACHILLNKGTSIHHTAWQGMPLASCCYDQAVFRVGSGQMYPLHASQWL